MDWCCFVSVVVFGFAVLVRVDFVCCCVVVVACCVVCVVNDVLYLCVLCVVDFVAADVLLF